MNSSLPIVLYGAGKNALSVLEQFRTQGLEPICFIDSDPNKQKDQYLGLSVLSLNEINAKYGIKGYKVYVTPNPPQKFEICHTILKSGVPCSNIINYEESIERIGCNSLEKCLLIFNGHFHYCCELGALHNASPICEIPLGNIADAVAAFVSYREQLIEDIQDIRKKTPCTGCPELEHNYYPVERKIRSISFSPAYPCNLHCSYCDVHQTAANLSPRDKKFLQTFDFGELIKELERKNLIDEINCPIELSAGEITINPKCAEILDAVKDYPVLVFSNCVIYDDRILQVIKKNNSFLLESLDAGTRETFAKIKGKDKFETVVENIKRYAQNGGNIQLKYIVMLENSNDIDLSGFLSICDEVQPTQIRLSCDIHNNFDNLPYQLIDFAIKLGKEAVKRNHKVLILEHFGGKNNQYIKQQVFGD